MDDPSRLPGVIDRCNPEGAIGPLGIYGAAHFVDAIFRDPQAIFALLAFGE